MGKKCGNKSWRAKKYIEVFLGMMLKKVRSKVETGAYY